MIARGIQSDEDGSDDEHEVAAPPLPFKRAPQSRENEKALLKSPVLKRVDPPLPFNVDTERAACEMLCVFDHFAYLCRNRTLPLWVSQRSALPSIQALIAAYLEPPRSAS